MTPKDLLAFAKRHWDDLAKLALWLSTVTCGFVVPAPVYDVKEDRALFWYGRFVLIVLSGLMLVPMNRAKRRNHVPWWALVGLVGLGISTGLFLKNADVRATKSTVIHGVRRAIGTH